MLLVRLKILLVTLRRSGARAWLAVSAVALAIASMMLMLALSAGADEELRTINDQLGRNLLGIAAIDVAAQPGRPQGWFASQRMKLEDVATLRAQLSGATSVVPVRESTMPVTFGRLALTTTILGATPDYLKVRNFAIADGRALDERDGASRSRVAVAGAFVARKLNGGFSLVGETLWIGRVPFEVVGQLAEKGASAEGQNEDDQIVIPIETALRRVSNTDSLSRLVVQFASDRQIEPGAENARELLRATHALDDDVKDDFRILRLVRANELRRRNSDLLQGLATIFAAVTLAIGGAGVLSVTVLNVKERVPEIGLRMAIGARPRDVTRLFVAEACVLSAMGGVLGLAGGRVSIALLARAVGWAMAVDMKAVLVPFAISVVLGIACSVVPAWKAASVMPVEALRDR